MAADNARQAKECLIDRFLLHLLLASILSTAPSRSLAIKKMKGNARLRSSLRLSIDASPYHLQVQPFNAPDSASPHSAGFSASSSKSSAGSRGYRICYALCLHDYLSDDPTHLPFTRNEILEIVAQENTGWWAAMRPGEDTVGWISRLAQLHIPVRPTRF